MSKRLRKAERMEARRAVGQRPPKPPPKPTRRAPYLVAHACFWCRRSNKRVPRETPLECSRCGGKVYEMGRTFRAPPADDVEHWLTLQLLYAHGYRFTGVHRSAPRLPVRVRDLSAFLDANPNHPLHVARPLAELMPWVKPRR
jgi:hypothetical protein